MERIDLTTPQLKQPLEAGRLILLQGERTKAFHILHSGLVEILFHENPSPQASEEEILRDSLRVGLIKGEAMIDVNGLLDSDEPYAFSVRAVSRCILTSRPMNPDEFVGRMQKDIPLNLKVLRDLVTRVESSFYIFKNYKYLWHKYASIADSLALGCGLCGSTAVGEKVERSSAGLKEYASYLHGLVQEREDLQDPDPWDHNLFLGRLQDSLRLYDAQDKLMVEDVIDNRQYLFVKRLLEKESALLAGIFQKDEPLNRYVFNFLGETIHLMLEMNKMLAHETAALISCLYGEEGWIHALRKKRESRTPQMRKFLHFLTKFSWRCRKDTLLLLGRDILKDYNIFSWLKEFRELPAPAEAPAGKAAGPNEELRKKRLAKYEGLLEKILRFSGLPREFQKEFAKLMDKFLKEEDKAALGKSVQALRNKLAEGYWQLYEACFLKIIDSDLKGFLPGVMLHFGLLDERLLSEEELLQIDDFYAGSLYSDETVPVMTLPYFLEKIYKSEIGPSMTEMGDSFAAVLAQQKKLTKKEKKGSYLFEDTPEDRVRFEIRKIARELSRILYGNKKKAIPFLCSHTLGSNLRRSFVDPEDLVRLVERYRSRDFSLFYREVLFKHSVGSEFVQKEVIPNFVFYPVAGNRSVLWQEMDGTKKDSVGRFFFPLFFLEKLEDALPTQLAYFRWEIQKTIAGYNWTDPVEGGLVGIYYDYIQFYKKNPHITPEAKERLEEFIKKTKSDKDRFARDYVTWVEYEYEGKLRLNNYARDIFYRYCPFPEEVRSQMSRKPAFGALETKFKNRRQKDILKLQSKMNKFQKKKVLIPQELADYMGYLER